MESCRLMKRRRPAAPNSRMDENMQASRIVPARGVIWALLWGHLLGVGGEFFPHCLHQVSIRPQSTGQKGRKMVHHHGTGPPGQLRPQSLHVTECNP